MKSLLSTFTLALSTPLFAADLDRDWPRWRGPDSSGAAATTASPPTTWSESSNIKWKVEVPGAGSSTPIVWGDRVYVSTAVKTDRTASASVNPTDATNDDARQRSAETARGQQSRDDRGSLGNERRAEEPSRDRGRGGFRGRRGGFGSGPPPTHYYDFMVIAYDRGNGEMVWKTTLTSQVPHEAGHNTNTFASSSPITDGERLYVSFGSRGIYALDFDGNQLWSKDLGRMQTRAQFGEGSSPAVHDGRLVVPFDHEGESFIVALDAKSGNELWRQTRDEQTTWSTPLITEYKGRAQVITNGSNRVRSYDLADGSLIWECGGQAGNPIPSPVRFEDNVIVMTGFRGYAIYSIPLSASGDITDTDVPLWVEEDAAPYVPSPLLYRGQLYFVKSNNGILISRDAKTGELRIDQTRLPDVSSVYASPVAANDNIYLISRDGTTVVFEHGDAFELVATNKLEGEFDASPAIVGDEIFLRSKSHLYCVSQ